MELIERWGQMWNRLKATEAELPSRVAIPADHVSAHESPNGSVPFISGEQYFQVTASEIFLKNGREWGSTYDPMAFVVSTFAYDKGRQAIPFVVGPSLLDEHKMAVPEGTLFTGTTVAGLHPYSGGSIIVTVFLYRVERRNYLRDILKLVEGAAGALNIATALTPYTKVAGVVLDGFEALLGREEVQPLLGSRDELGGAGKSFKPAYYALIDEPDVDARKLWVEDGRLRVGPTLAESKHYRDNDFVLYGVEQALARNDEKQLAFWPQWERVLEDAATPTEAGWQSAKANMAALQRALLLSPDLTEPQKTALADDFIDRMLKIHNRAVKTSALGAEAEETSDLAERNGSARAHDRALEILNL